MQVLSHNRTTYPFAQCTHPKHDRRAALPFIALNPPPFRLPGGELFKVPLDFRPDPAKVDKAKRVTAWKVRQLVSGLRRGILSLCLVLWPLLLTVKTVDQFASACLHHFNRPEQGSKAGANSVGAQMG